MEEGRLEILRMLEEKKITVEEAMQLLQALKAPAQNAGRVQAEATPRPQPQPNWDRHSNDHETRSSTRNTPGWQDAFNAFSRMGTNYSGARLEGTKLEGANLLG